MKGYTHDQAIASLGKSTKFHKSIKDPRSIKAIHQIAEKKGIRMSPTRRVSSRNMKVLKKAILETDNPVRDKFSPAKLKRSTKMHLTQEKKIFKKIERTQNKVGAAKSKIGLASNKPKANVNSSKGLRPSTISALQDKREQEKKEREAEKLAEEQEKAEAEKKQRLIKSGNTLEQDKELEAYQKQKGQATVSTADPLGREQDKGLVTIGSVMRGQDEPEDEFLTSDEYISPSISRTIREKKARDDKAAQEAMDNPQTRYPGPKQAKFGPGIPSDHSPFVDDPDSPSEEVEDMDIG